jgi:ElaB/YqjD/DUF883 family membrane-anchored ribosome-binding protein
MQDTELDAARAQLLEDLGKVVGDSEALLRSMASATGERAAEIRASVEQNLESVRARLRELQGTAVERTAAAARATDAYVHENPWTAIGLAAAVGVIVGMVISSRR